MAPRRIAEPLLPFKPIDRRRRLLSRRKQRSWRIAAACSVGFHALLFLAILLLARHRPAGPGDLPDGAVELLMVEKAGSGDPVPPAPSMQPAPPQPQAQQKPTAEAQSPPVQPKAPEPRPRSDEAGEAVPPDSPQVQPQPPDQAREAKITPPPQSTPQPAPPVFNLNGTDSESNAIVLGSHVIPASPDDRFRNRPPIFPHDAAIRGEHGAVVIVIHVSEFGSATGADVAETSGVESLDRAALDAVRRWHFRPAIKEGRAVPFDMSMRFIFESE